MLTAGIPSVLPHGKNGSCLSQRNTAKPSEMPKITTRWENHPAPCELTIPGCTHCLHTRGLTAAQSTAGQVLPCLHPQQQPGCRRPFIQESITSGPSLGSLSPIIPRLLSVLTLELHPFFFLSFSLLCHFGNDFAALTECFLCLEAMLSPKGEDGTDACLLPLFQMIILFLLSIPGTK